jgi:hypothetical protein
MRVPITIWPNAVPFMRRASRHLTTTLVDDMDSSAPTKMPCSRVTGQNQQQLATDVVSSVACLRLASLARLELDVLAECDKYQVSGLSIE